MITVAYFHHESNYRNGSTKSLLNMIHSLNGIVRPIVIFPSEGSTVEWFRSLGIESHVIPFLITASDGKSVRFWKIRMRFEEMRLYSKTFSLTKHFLKDKKVDIIHTNVSVIQFGFDLAKATGIPHVWHLREFIDKDFNLKPMRGFRKLRKDINKSDLTISITNAVRDHFHKHISINNLQIFNAILRIPYAHVVYNKKKYFLFVGRLDDAKGVFDAIEAFSIFHKNHTDFKLKLVGSHTSENLSKINNLISKFEIEKCVEIQTFTNDLDSLYSNATALLMCSRMEALGRVTVEAMDHGCPVIGRNSGGTSEIITHGVNGLLFDTIEDCVKQMEYVLDSEISKRLIEGGKKRSLDFTEDVYRKKIIKAYRNLLNRKQIKY